MEQEILIQDRIITPKEYEMMLDYREGGDPCKLTWRNCSFDKHCFDIAGQRLCNMRFEKCDFSFFRFYDVNFTKCEFKDCDFSSCNGSACYEIFTECEFTNCFFCEADLTGSIIKRCTLRECDFTGAVLSCVNIIESTVSKTYFNEARMVQTALLGTDVMLSHFYMANMTSMEVTESQILDSDIFGADLYDACFHNSKLEDVKYDKSTRWYEMHCPEKGEFIGYKKLRGGIIATLLIPEDALRASGTTGDCRCSKALVTALSDGATVGHNFSFPELEYRLGEWVVADGFNPDRWTMHSNGIHFFMTEREAQMYTY